jgi:uncharacterized membrane protein YesL
MEINPDSRTVEGISSLVMLIVLNVIYLVCCVPIVTIGAATAALLAVMHRFAEEERGHLVRGYFSALRRDWLTASLVWLVLAVPAALLAFSAVFWISLGGLSVIVGIIAAVAFVYCVAAMVFALAQVSRFENTVLQTVKNSLMFPMAHPLVTGGILVVLAVAPALIIVFHPAAFLYGTVGAAFSAYVIVRLTGRAFAAH